MKNYFDQFDNNSSEQVVNSVNSANYFDQFDINVPNGNNSSNVIDTQPENSFFTNLGRGFVEALKSRGLGIMQAGADALPNSIVSPDTKQLLKDEAALQQAKREQGVEGVGGFIGGIAGDPLTYAPIPGGGGILAGAAKGAGIGAISGATTPVSDGQSRALNTAAGTGLGAAAGAVIPAISKGFQNALGIDHSALDTFTKAGIDPTLPSIAGRTAAITDRTLLEVPGSAGVIQKSANKTLSQLQDKVGAIASGQGKAATATEAGKTVQSGTEGFIGRFNNKANVLYDKLGQYIKPEDQISAGNTQKYVNDIATKFNDLPSLQGIITDPVISTIKNDLNNANGILKYNSLRNLRTTIGKKLQNISLDGDQRAALSGLYGALSNDMKAAAASKGDAALQTFNRANTFYAAGKNRIDGILTNVVNSEAPEKAFNLAMQGTKDGAYNLAKLKKSLKPNEFGALQSAVINRMGLANPSSQDAVGNVFSATSFLTRYNQLSPEAKKVLFGGNNFPTKELDNLTKVMSNIKNVEKLTNNSGTGRVMGQFLTAGAVVNPATRYPALAALAGANISARLITNPTFTKWLAGSLKATNSGAISARISQLSAIAANNPDIRDDVSDYLKSLTSEQQ